MKKIALIIFTFSIVFTLACKKKCDGPNVTLYNKSLNEIRYCINGKWQIHKVQGGFALQVLYPQNTFIEFKFAGSTKNDSIKHYNDTSILGYNKVTWSNEFTNSWIADNTYQLRYTDNYMFPQSKIINEIINDTLVINDTYPDGYTFYCTRK